MLLHHYKYISKFLVILVFFGLYSGCRFTNKPKPIYDEIWSGISKNIDDNKEFIAVDYGPIGIVNSQFARSNIYVVFSKPVVPLARLGESLTESNV